MDDAELVQRAATCDKEAFAHVYDRYAGRLHEFLWWVLQDRADADEALYETFLEAGSHVHELGEPARLRPWLFAIASRQALHRAPRHPEHDDSPVVAPDKTTTWTDLVHVVQAVGEDLTPRDRALLDLRHRQGLGDDELGAAIGTEPDSAAALVERVTERVERTLGDTVVAYLGQQDCPELQEVLGDFDGRLTERQRQIVEQHAGHCERCGARAGKHVAATALLRVTPPAAPVPADVTARVLDDVQLTSHTGRPWSSRRNGFPPPLATDERRRWGFAAAAAIILLVGVIALIATRDHGGGEQVAAVGTTVAAPLNTATTRLTTTSAGVTTSSSSTTIGDGGAGGAAATPSTTRASGGGGGSSGGGGGGGSGTGTGSNTGTGNNTGGGSSSNTTTTEAPPPSTTTTTQPPDTTGPSLSGFSVGSAAVRPNVATCTNGDPTTTSVSITATDPSGIASVTARFTISGGTVSLSSSGGGTYSGTLGPFTSPAVAGTNIKGPVLITATDNAGNASSKSFDELALRCS